MTPEDIEGVIDDATFDYSMGDAASAVAKLSQATAAAPESFAAWHARAEIQFSQRDLDSALRAAERAHALRPDDTFINTTLSRIWLERGDKQAAEKYGAQARILSWKDQLKKPQGQPDGIS